MSNKKRICQEQQTFDQLYQPQEQEILMLTDSSSGGGAGKGISCASLLGWCWD